jgi:hypothetical protein
MFHGAPVDPSMGVFGSYDGLRIGLPMSKLMGIHHLIRDI